MITREFNLYLHAGHSIPLVINVNQYDRGEQWLFTLFNSDGTQYTPSSGAIVGIKSDNLGIINSGSVDAQGRVVINETQQMTAAAGKAVYELLVDDQTHGTANFVVLVEAKPGDNADLSESDYSLFQDAINSIAIAGSGAPAVATTASEMTDTGKIYLYAGTETGYTAGHWYYYKGSAWVDGGKYGGTVDATLTVSGAAADSKKVGDEILELKSQITTLEAIPRSVKTALDTLLHNVAFKDDDVYSDELTVFHAWASAITLLSISAVYTQGEKVVYETDSLETLKSNLVVTASYDDGSTANVSEYTLSGTLAEGTSTITVSYNGKTTTFDVTVTHCQLLYSLYDREFAKVDGGGVNTGITLMDEDRDFTILFDITQTAHSSGNRYIRVPNGIYIGSVSNTGTSKTSFQWYDVGDNYGNFGQATSGRIRIMVSHAKDSDSLIAKYKVGTDTISTITVSHAFSALTSVLWFGANGTTNFVGTLHKAELYDVALDADSNAVSAFFGA